MDSTPHVPTPSRRRTSRTARALVAASLTGAIAVAGVVSAGAASAADLKSGSATTLSPTVQAALVPTRYPFPDPGGCIVCGLGGFDPILDPSGPIGPYGTGPYAG